ncbi:MAG TPA: zf-HC2 domain-containing protein [Mycobacteriales bacterium]|nr:zf-HC2 domain-containing protein [Mycobacteriales bacterium]
MTCRYGRDDAAYMLGALDPEERQGFEQHLESCPACTAAVRDLAGLPGLLARLPADLVSTMDGVRPGGPVAGSPVPGGSGVDDPPLPATLLPTLLRQARRERRRSRWRTGLVAGTAAAAVAVGGTVLVERVTSARPGPAPPTRTVMLAPVGEHGAHGTAWLTARAWGSAIRVRCAAESGGDYGGSGSAGTGGESTSYTLYVTDRSGRSTAAASWRAVPGRDVNVDGATELRTDDVADLQVRDNHGAVVMRGTG